MLKVVCIPATKKGESHFTPRPLHKYAPLVNGKTRHKRVKRFTLSLKKSWLILKIFDDVLHFKLRTTMVVCGIRITPLIDVFNSKYVDVIFDGRTPMEIFTPMLLH